MIIYCIKKWKKFPCGTEGRGSGIVTIVSQTAAVVQVQFLAQELPHTLGVAKKKKERTYETDISNKVTLKYYLFNKMEIYSI